MGKTFNLGKNSVPLRKITYKYDPCVNNLKTNSEVIVANESYFKKVPDKYSECGKPLLHSAHEKNHSGMEKYKYNPIRKARSQNEDLTLHQIIYTVEELFEYNKCGKAFFKWAVLITQKRVHAERK